MEAWKGRGGKHQLLLSLPGLGGAAPHLELLRHLEYLNLHEFSWSQLDHQRAVSASPRDAQRGSRQNAPDLTSVLSNTSRVRGNTERGQGWGWSRKKVSFEGGGRGEEQGFFVSLMEAVTASLPQGHGRPAGSLMRLKLRLPEAWRSPPRTEQGAVESESRPREASELTPSGCPPWPTS